MYNRILIINPFGIGDVLFSTPLVSVIKVLFPNSYIGYICNIKTAPILMSNPQIDEVFVFERGDYRFLWKKSKIKAIVKFFGFWQEIAGKKFDVVFDISLGKEYAFFCWLSGIKKRIGFDYKNRGRFLTNRFLFSGFSDKPIAEYYLDLIKPVLKNYKLDFSKLELVLIPQPKDIAYIDKYLKEAGVNEQDILIGIAPGGGASFGAKNQDRRRWMPERFRELAERIMERCHAKVILIWGGYEEEQLAIDISRGLHIKPLLAPKTTIMEMAALMKRCKIVVCNDSGLLHVAVSQNVPTISMFGPANENVYGPYPKSSKNIVLTSSAECRPCYNKFKLPECKTRKCLDDISVDKVFEAIEQVGRFQ